MLPNRCWLNSCPFEDSSKILHTFHNAQIDGERECIYVHAHGWVHSPPDLTPQEGHAPLTPSSEKMMQMEPQKDEAAKPSEFTASVTEEVLCSVDRYKDNCDLKCRRRLDVVWRGFPCEIIRREKKVHLMLIISEHDAQIMGLLIDCADCTITETSNYHDMDLVMINDEWARLSSTSAPLLLLSFHSTVLICFILAVQYIREDHRVFSIAVM